MSRKPQKVMALPINHIFRLLQTQQRVEVWLFEQKYNKIEGVIIGFDEYMNVVLDNATEINTKKKEKIELGRILLKGDNITMMKNASS